MIELWTTNTKLPTVGEHTVQWTTIVKTVCWGGGGWEDVGGDGLTELVWHGEVVGRMDRRMYGWTDRQMDGGGRGRRWWGEALCQSQAHDTDEREMGAHRVRCDMNLAWPLNIQGSKPHASCYSSELKTKPHSPDMRTYHQNRWHW